MSRTVAEQFADCPFRTKGFDEDSYRRARHSCGIQGLQEAAGWPSQQTIAQGPTWAAVYPRPSQRNSPDLPGDLLRKRQEMWDEAEVRLLDRLEVSRDYQARRDTEEQAKRDRQQAEADATNAKALADETERLKRIYLSQPGATLAEFERDLPDLLRERRRAAVLNTAEAQSPISLADMLR